MKILITGGTGFLGKQLLNLLVDDSRIEQIHVITRHKKSHPNAKIRLLKIDLSDPASLETIPSDSRPYDTVIHLAGLYDFKQSMSQNYQMNYLSTLNLIDWIKSNQPSDKLPTILYASTYAVGLGTEAGSNSLPPQSSSYAYTKALSELAIAKAGIPAWILRLGILVGDSKEGFIEKADGPYYLLNLLANINNIPVIRNFPKLPIPARPEAILPLVPIDVAARIFAYSLFASQKEEYRAYAPKIFGVYDKESISVQDFCKAAFKHLLPNTRPSYASNLSRTTLRYLMPRQERLTKIPPQIFDFALQTPTLCKDSFTEHFPECGIPHFSTYSEAFFRGFWEYRLGATKR